MWLEKIRTFYQKHSGKFTGLFIAVIVTIWLLGPLLWEVLPLKSAIAVSVAIVLLMLGLIQDFLASIKKPSNVQVSPAQNEITSEIIDSIKTEKPRTASLLMYSSSVFQEVIKALIGRDVESELHLLLQSPKEKAVIIEYQQGRICGGVKILSEVLRNYGKAKIRVYREPASLRGMKLGHKLISVGWYTYDCRDETLGDKQIWGHNNAMLTAPLATPEGQVLARTFDEVFKNLWDKGSTLKEICGSCNEKERCLGTNPDEWLDLVS